MSLSEIWTPPTARIGPFSETDRLARSLKTLITTAEALEDRGIGLVSLTESIDTTTPGGVLVFHVFGVIASSSAP